MMFQPMLAAFLGGWEIIFVMGALGLLLALFAAVGVLIKFLVRHRQPIKPSEAAIVSPPRQTPSSHCSHCGKPVPASAPGGICPECMLQAGLATQTEAPETGPGGTKIVQPPASTAEIAPLFPQLEILECLGRGGMGTVYKARQPRLDRLVALKILAPERQDDPQFAERFEREARALARLTHPNIVGVYDFGEMEGRFFLLMEYVDGLSLRQLLQREKMKPEQALAIVPEICEALQYAHEQGVVHRDIKPENILLDRQGRVKIADFGIAKMVGAAAGQQNLTGAKDVMGTPHYMAPEQIEKPQTVDHRADIYSLGVVFYEMLTGELPLGKFQPPSRKVQIDVRLDDVVLHALEKEPELRYQQASQVKTDVETITTTPGTAASSAINRPAAAAYTASPPFVPAQKSDHFWRFIVIVFLVIPVLGLLGRIALQNFIKNRATPQPAVKSDYIGQAYFPKGDAIEITSVVLTNDQMMVNGHYNLVSDDTATLELRITTTSPAAQPAGAQPRMQISKGRGDFALACAHVVPGLPHVRLNSVWGKRLGELYFGTKAEALEESKLVLAVPEVVSVFPPDGATNVDLLQELRIRFDQPMNSNDLQLNWSSGGFFPNGQSRYESARNEFVIPVRLLPNQTNKLRSNYIANGGFRNLNFGAADEYHWQFTTRPAATSSGAPRPKVIQISPSPGESLPVLTMLEVTFDQPMTLDYGFPHLRGDRWGFEAPFIIPSFNRDASGRRLTLPLVLPPDNETKLILDGFFSAEDVDSDPIVLRCEIGTNNYSAQQEKEIETASKDPRLEQLLSSVKAARDGMNSGIETVQQIMLSSDFLGKGCYNGITAYSATFKWQRTNQVYADISDIMNTKAFILGCDGSNCWLYSDDDNGGRRLLCSPVAEVKSIYTSVADPLDLTRQTVAWALANERLIYEGPAQVDGRACVAVDCWMVRQPKKQYEPLFAMRSKWWIDSQTFLPVQLIQHTSGGEETYHFHFAKLNQPLPDAAFQPPVEPGANLPSADWYDKPLGPDEQRFFRVKDGSDGRMSGRIGRQGPNGSTDSGLN
jgi:serine/threonine protein kinase/outer membrane lipoprotein-sorting protein